MCELRVKDDSYPTRMCEYGSILVSPGRYDVRVFLGVEIAIYRGY
jgi:hypothetical protein